MFMASGVRELLAASAECDGTLLGWVNALCGAGHGPTPDSLAELPTDCLLHMVVQVGAEMGVGLVESVKHGANWTVSARLPTASGLGGGFCLTACEGKTPTTLHGS